MRDFDAELERHQRRVTLMRLAGDIDRQDTRNRIMMAVAAGLGMIALCLAVV